MNLPSDTPRLPKWIFLTLAAALLVTAWFVWTSASHPALGLPLISVLICVTAAAVLGVIPFLADYAHSQDEALDNRQRSLQALSVTVAAAAEQISIAATGLQGIAEAAQENLGKAEKTSEQIREKMVELTAVLAAAKKDDGESAARLEAVAKKIAKSVGELEAAAARAAQPAHPQIPAYIPELPPVPPSRIVEIRPAVLASEAPFVSKPVAAVPAPAAEDAPAPAPAAEPAPPPPVPRKRAPRKPAAPPAEAPAQDLVLEAQSPAGDAPPAPAAEHPEPAVSADGATRLVVTAYIGIGNRLFIRGDGPGLTWEKGVPLSFVSIGKWRWETSDATRAVKYKLYKNDETLCESLGEGSVEPGAQLELSASF